MVPDLWPYSVVVITWDFDTTDGVLSQNPGSNPGSTLDDFDHLFGFYVNVKMCPAVTEPWLSLLRGRRICLRNPQVPAGTRLPPRHVIVYLRLESDANDQ